MKIREINAMRGPNYWSIRRHKLIVMVLDLEEMEEKPSNVIVGFSDRLKNKFPSMYSHRCSEGCEGGFFMRVDEGTWMGHVIEHIALEIQTLAGMDTGFGRTRDYGEKGVYNVVFSYLEENAGKYAAEAAVRICESLISGEEYDMEPDIQKMRELRESERLGPSTGSIVEEAASRGIPWIRLNKYSLCQLGYGANQKRIQATVTSETSSIGVEIACDKEDTKFLLMQAEVEVPKGEIISRESSLEAACRYVKYPLVIKPIDGNHGRGITVNINTYEEAIEAFHAAKLVSQKVIVEKFITGEDYRLLVINHKLIAAAHAGCFAMKLSFNLSGAGFVPDELDATCHINFENGAVTSSHLILKACVVGIDSEKFDELVKDAEANCPISKLLNTAISVDYTLN